MDKPKQPSSPPPFPPTAWQVVEVTEGKRRWYEVHSTDGWLHIVDGDSRATWRTRSLRRAARTAERWNRREQRRAERRERVIPGIGEVI